jgi:UDPglucose--hexose-1-phosphate uridylyltransferase
MKAMFSVRDVKTGRGTLQYREEEFTGLRCRISPDRLKRNIDKAFSISRKDGDCPFCPENVFRVTPTFPDGTRILKGESVTFPNLYPFGEHHIVTVITREHSAEFFSRRQLVDAISSQIEALQGTGGYPSINWNFLPSSGASLVHPHMQGISDSHPSELVRRYLAAGEQYRARHNKSYWDAVREAEHASERYLFGEEIVWSAHAVPVGEREVRGLMPISSIDQLDPFTDLPARGILEVLALYRACGTSAFNLSVFFDQAGTTGNFRAFCSMISRINPNPSSTSDSAFMERLHLEPVIMTPPEELGRFYRKKGKK